MTGNSKSISPATAVAGSAWVTGAGTGIGRALARRLAEEGWNVAISARTERDLDSLAAEMPARIHPFQLDVTDAARTREAAAAIEEKLGPLDLVVLNAGIYQRDSAAGFDAQAFGAMVDVNLMGSVHCLTAILPGMIARRSGHVAVVASVSGYTGLPGGAGYGATKAALITMCQALYPELQTKGVLLSVINPGFVDTPLTRRNDFPMPFIISTDEAVDHIMKGLASRRFEIAFPWKMVLAMKLLAALPARLRFAITRRMIRD